MSVKISALTEVTVAATGDLFVVVDVSDTSMAATGTDKKITLGNLLNSSDTQLLFNDGGAFGGDAGLTYNKTSDVLTSLGGYVATIGTITTNKPALSATQEWNDGAVTFKGIFLNVTATAQAAASRVMDLQAGGSTVLSVDKDGTTRSTVFLASSVWINGGNVSDINSSNYQLTAGAALDMGNTVGVRWSNAAGYSSGKDTGIFRNAAGVVEINNGTAGTYAAEIAAEYRFGAPTSANGQYLAAKSLTELTTIAAAATTDTTIQMPANAIVLGVSVRVTTAIPTAATFTVGDSGSAARFSTAAVSTAANSTDKGTKAGAYYNATALSVRITPNLTPAANTGRVRTTIHYLEMQAPTS